MMDESSIGMMTATQYFWENKIDGNQTTNQLCHAIVHPPDPVDTPAVLPSLPGPTAVVHGNADGLGELARDPLEAAGSTKKTEQHM